jgi:hypothetical protein
VRVWWGVLLGVRLTVGSDRSGLVYCEAEKFLFCFGLLRGVWAQWLWMGGWTYVFVYSNG